MNLASGLRVIHKDPKVAGRYIKLAVVPTRALRLACGTDISLRIAVEDWDKLRLGREIGDPTTVDRDKPEIARFVESPTLKKLTLRLVVNICEQRDWPNTRWWRWQAPWLHMLRRWWTREWRCGNWLILTKCSTDPRC